MLRTCPCCDVDEAQCDCPGSAYRRRIERLVTALAPLARQYEVLGDGYLARALDATLARVDGPGGEAIVRVAHARDAAFVLEEERRR